MAIVFIDVYGRCDLPVGNCSDVVLCMTPVWAERTVNGFAIAFGRIAAEPNRVRLPRTPSAAYRPCCTEPYVPAGCPETPVVPPVGSCCPTYTPPVANPCCPTACGTGYEICVYHIEIDTEQFLIDPFTSTNYVPICSDFLDIMPYPCVIGQLIDGIPLTVIDTPTVDLTYIGGSINSLQADVILDPDSNNILDDATGLLATIVSDGTLSGAGTSGDPLTVIGVAPETPNSRTVTPSTTITLTGALNRDIQVDVDLSAEPDQAITEEVDGLHVQRSYADTESDAVSGDAAALDISAAATYVIATSNIITVNNPSTSSPLAFKLDGDTNVQCILQTLGVWQLILEQSVNGAPWSTYAVAQYGTFSGVTGLPLTISAGYETEIPAGGSLTIVRRVSIQTVTPSAPGSVAGLYSTDMRAIWVTK